MKFFTIIQKIIVVTAFMLAPFIAFAQPFAVADLEKLTPHYLTVNHGRLEYYRFGHGKPIVLISGYATSVTSWNRYFLTALAAKHEVIVFNNRDVGGSLIKSMRYTAEELAEDAHQLIAHLNLKDVTVGGISMGGMIAQQLAILHPRDIRHLVLINTAIAGKQAVPPSTDVEQVILNTPEGLLTRYIVGIRLLTPPAWWIQMTIGLVRDQFKPTASQEMGVSADTLIKQQQLILGWAGNNKAAKQIKHLTMPTLILSGGSDIVIPPENSDILAKTITHSQLIRWMDGGHAIIYQYPQKVALAINNFVE